MNLRRIGALAKAIVIVYLKLVGIYGLLVLTTLTPLLFLDFVGLLELNASVLLRLLGIGALVCAGFFLLVPILFRTPSQMLYRKPRSDTEAAPDDDLSHRQ